MNRFKDDFVICIAEIWITKITIFLVLVGEISQGIEQNQALSSEFMTSKEVVFSILGFYLTATS